MRELTIEEIKDLEARGIKPGVLVKCPRNDRLFIVKEWSDYEAGTDWIASKNRESDGFFEWLKRNSNYATPVELQQFQPHPIDWEARRWELAIGIRLHLDKDPIRSIAYADQFISEYKNTQMP